MALENKLGLTSSAELAQEEERISKKKALDLFESRALDRLAPGASSEPLSPTGWIVGRSIEGIDHSYHYGGYTAFKSEELL